MSVPDFQSFFLPLLEHTADGKEHTAKEAREGIAKVFNLSDGELKEMLPSGKQTTFANRLAWAKVYLNKAGLIETPQRGHFRITERGREVLAEKPEKLNVRYLKKYPEFENFHQPSVKPPTGPGPIEPLDKTPEEALEEAYQNLRNELASEVMEHIQNNPPEFFERLVVQLLVKMGYGGSIKDAGQAMGKSGDEGIDGIIKEDKLGLDVIYIQAKRWQGNVGRPEIQKFVGALHGQRAKKGVFITTSTFSNEARQYVSQIDPKVVLIDGEQLVDMMIDYDLGVSTVDTYKVKKIDMDFFIEE